MEFGDTFWALVGLIIFLGLMVYLGVPKMIGTQLDKRSKAIADELEEARRLREEAQALLADYQRKRQGAEQEAEEIVTAAKAEAARITDEAEVSLAAMIERRTKAVEDKIAQAETRALAEVRSVAAEVAVAAAARVLTAKVKDDVAARLLDQGIAEVKAKLH